MYRLRVKYRQNCSVGQQVVMAEGTSESAAKAALVRMTPSYSNAIILDVEMA